MKYIQNLHTHSTYCDGKDSLEEIVLEAVRIGMDSIGFSGHSNMNFVNPKMSMTLEATKEYKAEIRKLKQKYDGIIDIFCGIEFEMYSKVDLIGYDYIIADAHYFMIDGHHVGFDRDLKTVENVIDTYFGGDGLKYAKTYFETISQLPKYAKNADIVGHFDLIAKHSETKKLFREDSKEYKSYVVQALEVLIKHYSLFEINTGAIARGYRSTPYPSPFILKEMKRLGARIVIGSDCHDKSFLTCNFKECAEIAKECGFKEAYVLKKSGFTPISIDEII